MNNWKIRTRCNRFRCTSVELSEPSEVSSRPQGVTKLNAREWWVYSHFCIARFVLPAQTRGKKNESRNYGLEKFDAHDADIVKYTGASVKDTLFFNYSFDILFDGSFVHQAFFDFAGTK